MTYQPQRPSAKRQQAAQAEAEAQADRIAAYIRAGLIVCAVVIAIIVTNSPGYERLIESIGSI